VVAQVYFGDRRRRRSWPNSSRAHDARTPRVRLRRHNSIPLGVADDGVAVSVRSGRYGPYLVHGEDASRSPRPRSRIRFFLSVARASNCCRPRVNDANWDRRGDRYADLLEAGRYGPYVQVGEMTDPKAKPRPASLLTTMSPESVTLAREGTLSLPRVVGDTPQVNRSSSGNGREPGGGLTRAASDLTTGARRTRSSCAGRSRSSATRTCMPMARLRGSIRRLGCSRE